MAQGTGKFRLVAAAIIGVIIMIIVGFLWHHHRMNAEQTDVTSVVSQAPKIDSTPGLGNPSAQYVQTQVAQNQKEAAAARQAGTSSVPTITRPDFIGNPAAFGVLDKTADIASPICAQGPFKHDPNQCTPQSLQLARNAGVNAEELTCQGCSCPALKVSGFTAGDLKAAGFTAADLRRCGFSLGQLIAAGFSPKELREAGYSAAQLANAGLTPAQLASAGFAPSDIAQSFTPSQLMQSGLSPQGNLLKNTVNCSPQALIKAHAAGVPASQLKSCGASALLAAGYDPASLRAAGFSAKDLKALGLSAAQLKAAGFNAGELKDASFSPEDLKAAGFSKDQLHAAGFSANDLKKAGFSAADLANAGYTKGDLLRAGFTPSEAGFVAPTTNTQGPDNTATSTPAPSLGASADMPSIQSSSADSQLARLAQAEQAQMTAQQRADAVQMMQGAMTMQAQKMLTDWNTHNLQEMHVAINTNNNSNGSGSGSMASLNSDNAAAAKAIQEANAKIYKSGAVMFAVLDTSVNSDEQTPILAQIVGGPLKGSRLIGQFNRVDKKVLISFNRLNVPGLKKSVDINAVAIDPDTARTAVAGEVNSHYLLRYGTLFASGFLQGLSNAVLQSNSSNQCSIFGCVTQRATLNVGQQIAVGLGQVGQNASQVMGDVFNTPPTIKIPGGTGIGVLIMSDLTVPQSN